MLKRVELLANAAGHSNSSSPARRNPSAQTCALLCERRSRRNVWARTWRKPGMGDIHAVFGYHASFAEQSLTTGFQAGNVRLSPRNGKPHNKRHTRSPRVLSQAASCQSVRSAIRSFMAFRLKRCRTFLRNSIRSSSNASRSRQ